VFIVRLKAERIFPNCPRSVYAPKPGHVPPVPAWKTFEVFKDAVPRRDRPADK
jgi:hypothetical protein